MQSPLISIFAAMENYVFLIFLLLLTAIFLITTQRGANRNKFRWLQGIFTVIAITFFVFWFYSRSEINLAAVSVPTAVQTHGTADLLDTNSSRAQMIRVAIISSINLLLLFINVVLLIRNMKLHRKEIVY